MSGPPGFPMPPGAGPPLAFPPGRPPMTPPAHFPPPGAGIPVVLPPHVRPPRGLFPAPAGAVGVIRPGMQPRVTPPPVTLPRPGRGMPRGAPPIPPPSVSVLQKSTSVYVGKIAITVDDATMRGLLEACGGVRSWKRQEDPETKQPKGFGFCEFEEAEGVLRALRLLNGLSLDGQDLLVKCNTVTQKYVDAYEREKMEKEKEEKEEGEHQDSDEARDNEVLEKIMGIISDREDQIKKHKAEDQKFSELLGGKEKSDSESTKDRDHRSRDRREREKDAEFDEKRDRERRAVEAKRKEEDRQFDRKVHEWERVERKRMKERDREKERQRDLDRERLRQIRADAEVSDSDDEREAWSRRSYRNSRRAEDRRRKRREESEWDLQDAFREEEELEAKKRKHEQQQEQDDMEGVIEHDEQMHKENGVDVHSQIQDQGKQTAEQEQAQGNASTADGIQIQKEVDPNDPIYRAMMEAMSAPKPDPSPPVEQQPSPVKRPSNILHAAINVPSNDQSNALAHVFGDDEDEKPQRQLRLLNYTEDEMKAGWSGQAQDDPKTRVKKLMDSIPTTKEGVFKYPIKWEAYDRTTLAANISQWVDRKIHDLLGVEEKSMVSFIMARLEERMAPEEMLSELSEVLDDEADTFILKLYRMVIYETEKLAAGLC